MACEATQRQAASGLFQPSYSTYSRLSAADIIDKSVTNLKLGKAYSPVEPFATDNVYAHLSLFAAIIRLSIDTCRLVTALVAILYRDKGKSSQLERR